MASIFVSHKVIELMYSSHYAFVAFSVYQMELLTSIVFKVRHCDKGVGSR